MSGETSGSRPSGALPRIIFMVGCGFFFSALMTGDPMQYFWGAVIAGGAVALHFSRRKDWKKHWEELDRRRGNLPPPGGEGGE